MTHVLIIDADKTSRLQTAQACKIQNYSVDHAPSAQKAITLCENQKPDVILLELHLSAHSGVEFIHELRSYPEWSKIPIVLYTHVPWANLQRFSDSFTAMGIVGYAYKPEASFKKLMLLIKDATDSST